jgi:hypothetical protein
MISLNLIIIALAGVLTYIYMKLYSKYYEIDYSKKDYIRMMVVTSSISCMIFYVISWFGDGIKIKKMYDLGKIPSANIGPNKRFIPEIGEYVMD